MTSDIMKLPYQWKDMEDKEYLESLRQLAQTVIDRSNTLSDLYFSGTFPADLKDYAVYLMHDSNGSAANLRYYISKNLTDATTWQTMYRCLQWIQHLDVLIELVDLRTNR
jgi:hypothetical protein